MFRKTGNGGEVKDFDEITLGYVAEVFETYLQEKRGRLLGLKNEESGQNQLLAQKKGLAASADAAVAARLEWYMGLSWGVHFCRNLGNPSFRTKFIFSYGNS
jgi:hypothetical protein